MMMAVWTFLTTRLGKILSSILFVVTALSAIFMAGKKSEEKGQEVEDLKEYKETKEKIDETPVSTTRDDALARLRKHNQLR
jgi:hypothetical protein